MKMKLREPAAKPTAPITPPSEVDRVVRATLNAFAREQNRAMAALATALAAAVDRDKFVAALQAEYNEINDINTPTDPSPATAEAILRVMLDAVRDRPIR